MSLINLTIKELGKQNWIVTGDRIISNLPLKSEQVESGNFISYNENSALKVEVMKSLDTLSSLSVSEDKVILEFGAEDSIILDTTVFVQILSLYHKAVNRKKRTLARKLNKRTNGKAV